MYVIKRNGKQVIFDKTKIAVAVSKANKEVLENKLSDDQINNIADTIESRAKQFSRALNIEEIQDMVENLIMYYNKYEVAKAYVLYRYKQKENRDNGNLFNKVNAIVNNEDEETKQENSNKDPEIISVQRDYIAGEVSKAMVRQEKYPKYIMDAHDAGLIHIHDCDYKICKETNCCLVNAEDMLQNGTVISKTKIDTPHSFSTASNIKTQIMAQVASSQYGGQSISLYHLVPFVEISRQAITKSVEEDHVPDEYKQEAITRRLKKEINKGVQTIQYQVSTLMTTNGQAPFITLFMYLNEAETEQEKEDLALIIEEVLKQRLQGVKNSDGVWVTPAFPKLIYVLEDDNTDEGSKYFYLTELAAKCTAKRMVPDYSSERKIIEAKYPTEKLLHIKDRRDQWGDEDIWGRNVFKNVTDEECDKLQEIVDNRFNKKYVIPDETKDIIKKYGLKMADITPKAILPMGCRSFLTPDFIHYKRYGRFNQGVCTINLVDVALSSQKNMDDFWKIFDERLQLCYEALMIDHNYLLGTKSDVAPMLWQYGALARLKEGETIDKLLVDNYSTISLGYAGLCECVKYMTGKSHTDPEAKPFALSIMKHLNSKCDEWRAQTNISFSVYGTPLESTTYTFAKALQKRFGIIKDVTDHNYITNSYHCSVREQIDAFTKLKFESEFQELSPGGAISYVEVPNMQNNIKAVISVIQFIANNIMYAELNTKSDYCYECGYDGEIQIVEDDNGKLVWECPKCHNKDQHRMSVARRSCGYIGTNFWNQGRTQEIKDRVLHL